MWHSRMVNGTAKDCLPFVNLAPTVPFVHLASTFSPLPSLLFIYNLLPFAVTNFPNELGQNTIAPAQVTLFEIHVLVTLLS